MSRIVTFKNYFFWFFVFGQNTCIPCDGSRRLKKICGLPYIPPLLHCSLTLLSSYIVITNQFRDISTNDDLVLIVRIASILIPNFFVIWQSFLMPRSTRRLVKTFEMLLAYLSQHFDLEVFSIYFTKNIWREIKWIAVYEIISFLLRILYRSPINSRIADFFTAISTFYKTIAIIHAIFYVNFGRSLLLAINQQLETTAEKSLECEIELNIKNQIRFLKKIELCQFNKIFNERFGWVLIPFLIDAFLILTKSLYWIFLYQTSFQGYDFLILRKYNFFLLSLLHCSNIFVILFLIEIWIRNI